MSYVPPVPPDPTREARKEREHLRLTDAARMNLLEEHIDERFDALEHLIRAALPARTQDGEGER